MQNYKINTQKNVWVAVGVMSGTSVDGLDLALVRLENHGEKWKFDLLDAVSIDYDSELKTRLIHCMHMSAEELAILDMDFGSFIGKSVSEFLSGKKMHADLIASHGHTVFHQPEKRLTLQIGNGQSILLETGILTVNDFRKIDVLKGGQGAPLVPIGDQYLFSDFDVCLNLGGFSNISYNDNNRTRMAFDTGPANLLLNHLARKIGYDYDVNGDMARSGNLIPELLHSLNDLPYYSASPPKSLGLEWVEKNIYSRMDLDQNSAVDLMHTCVHHISFHINQAIRNEAYPYVKAHDSLRILTTGGGAYNSYLMECIQNENKTYKYEKAAPEIIDFKEAIIFAFLGVLRIQKKINTLCTVTGSKNHSVGGTIHDNELR